VELRRVVVDCVDQSHRSAQGKPIRTLADARAYILALPKKRQKDEDVQAACEALLMAAEHPAAILHANIGIGRVVHGKPEQIELPRSRRKR
jgi:hypothetical protein